MTCARATRFSVSDVMACSRLPSGRSRTRRVCGLAPHNCKVFGSEPSIPSPQDGVAFACEIDLGGGHAWTQAEGLPRQPACPVRPDRASACIYIAGDRPADA